MALRSYISVRRYDHAQHAHGEWRLKKAADTEQLKVHDSSADIRRQELPASF